MAKVLCLFDDRDAIERLARELAVEHDLDIVSDAEVAIRNLQHGEYDVLVCSAFLKARTVVAILLRLRQAGVMDHTRVFCLRDTVDAVAIASDKLLKHTTTAMGASDYMSLEKFIRSHRDLLRPSMAQ